MTSQHEREEFARLLAAHSNREIADAGVASLRRLASADPELGEELDAIDTMLATFDGERLLRSRILRPGDPRDEASPRYQALSRAAGRAEHALRERLLEQPVRPVVVARPVRARQLAWALLVAAAVLLGVFLALHRSPPLLTESPRDERAGPVAAIVLTPQISANASIVEWQAVAGASHYDVSIEDADANVVFSRGSEAKKSTRWDLSRDQIETLKSMPSLFLRVVARDGVGLVLASSHDVPLSVK